MDKIVYLDNAATSFPKPACVMQAMMSFASNIGANPGRSGHRLSIEAGRVLYQTRDTLAQLFNIGDPLQIVFTKNATEALNMALFGLLKPGDHVIASRLEHNSVARPLRYLETKGVTFTCIDLHTGTADAVVKEIEGALQPNTRAIVVNHASNVIGAVAPLHAISEQTRKHGLLLIVDAAQTAGALPIDVAANAIDALAFTGHKSLLGPQGTGCLYVRAGLEIEPLILGGTGSASESDEQPPFMPDSLESGTPNTIGLAGLGAAIQTILETGVSAIAEEEDALRRYFLEGLRNINRVKIYGHVQGPHMPTISINIDGLTQSEVGFALDDKFGIMVRVGLHCSPWAHRAIGTNPDGTVRFSLGRSTTRNDIDYALNAINKIAGRVDIPVG